PTAPENPCTLADRLRPGCAPMRWSGELHLEWPLVTSASGAVVTAPRVLQTAQQDPEDAADTGDPEEAIEDLFAQLTPEQQADFQAILPPVPEALPDSVLVIPRFVDSPPAPASVPPKSVAVFDPTQPQRMNDIVM